MSYTSLSHGVSSQQSITQKDFNALLEYLQTAKKIPYSDYIRIKTAQISQFELALSLLYPYLLQLSATEKSQMQRSTGVQPPQIPQKKRTSPKKIFTKKPTQKTFASTKKKKNKAGDIDDNSLTNAMREPLQQKKAQQIAAATHEDEHREKLKRTKQQAGFDPFSTSGAIIAGVLGTGTLFI